MKPWIVAIALLVGVFTYAQDQSTCPAPRQQMPTSNCSSGDFNRNIRVRVAALSSGHSIISPEAMTDTVERVERHTYRSCDIGLEIIDRVKESFQHLGYFCADVEPIAAQQTGKNEYNITIHVHLGEQYRVGELSFTGATILSADELRSELHIKPNSVFNTESVRRGLENIQKSYAKKGHPNVTAIPIASVDEKNRRIALEIKIQESAASQ
jgi:outer membrane translocation and assembly module TamA